MPYDSRIKIPYFSSVYINWYNTKHNLIINILKPKIWVKTRQKWVCDISILLQNHHQTNSYLGFQDVNLRIMFCIIFFEIVGWYWVFFISTGIPKIACCWLHVHVHVLVPCWPNKPSNLVFRVYMWTYLGQLFKTQKPVKKCCKVRSANSFCS
jgi:hypothetical protein